MSPRSLVTLASFVALAGAAHAGISPSMQIRSCRSLGGVFSVAGQLHDDRSVQAPDFTTFDDGAVVDLMLGQAIAQAGTDQLSSITERIVRAELGAGAVVSTGVNEVSHAQSDNTFFVMFTIPTTQTWRLDAVIPWANNSAWANVTLRRNGQTIAELASWVAIGELHETMTLEPGEYVIDANANANAVVCGGPLQQQSEAALGFVFRDLTDAVPGDVNDDLVVNFTDLMLILGHFGMEGTIGFVEGDLDFDGRVAFSDLNAVLSNYGAGG